jgi:allophanate hydrolase
VDLALGTDTAGSGRVPAAYGGIIGLKATRGLVPTRGVVPACRTLDCVSVFASTVAAARQAITIMTGPDPRDPTSRAWPADRPLAAPPTPVIAIPLPDQLAALSPSWRAAFTAACQRLSDTGAQLTEIDISAFLEAGSLLYNGAFIAERYAAVGEFVTTHADEVDPTVGAIIASARDLPAHQLVADTARLDALKLRVAATFADVDALFLPTAPEQPTIAAVAGDRIGVNARLGAYTTFCNMLDLAAVAVPAGEVDGGQFGVSVIVSTFADAVAADIAARFAGEPAPEQPIAGIPLVVVGAHLSGLALNHQLVERGCRLIGPVATAASYRLFALDTQPPKPALVRVDSNGASIAGELWDVPPAQLAGLLAALPAPMVFGQVQLADGTAQVGFLCEAVAALDAPEITDFGGWRAYLARG